MFETTPLVRTSRSTRHCKGCATGNCHMNYNRGGDKPTNHFVQLGETEFYFPLGSDRRSEDCGYDTKADGGATTRHVKASNESTPAHRNCIPNSPYRLIPHSAKQPPSTLHATQPPPHLLHRSRPRRTHQHTTFPPTRTRTDSQPRASHHSRSRSRRRGRRGYDCPRPTTAEQAEEHPECGQQDAEKEERRVADVWAERGVHRLDQGGRGR